MAFLEAMDPSTTVVQVLKDLSPNDVINSNDIKEAFEDLINRGDQNFRNLVSQWIKSHAGQQQQQRRKRSGDVCEDEVTDRARRYFNNRPQKKQVVLLRALKGLRSGSEKPADFYTGPWLVDDHIFKRPGIDAPTRVNCLLEAHARIERDTILNQFMRRVNLVYIAYEVGRLEQTAVPPAKERRVTAATRQLAEQTGFAMAHINDLRWRGRGYTKLMDVWGPGALCVIGESVKDIWENVLTNGEISDLIAFCDRHATIIAERARNLNDVTGRAILSGLQRYGGDLEDFQRHDSILLRCLRKHCPGLLYGHVNSNLHPNHDQITNAMNSSPGSPMHSEVSQADAETGNWGEVCEGNRSLSMQEYVTRAPAVNAQAWPSNILNSTAWLDDLWPSVHNDQF